MNTLADFIGNPSLTISEAMQIIDKNTRGILFLVDNNNILSGCVTDGDIRRYLLAGGKMGDLVAMAANKSPKFTRSIEEAKKLYHVRNYTVIPIVDESNHIVNLYADGLIGCKEKVNLNVPVVINAGGKGTRLEPYTRILPKPLIPVGDLPIIEHIMNEYQLFGCDDFHIILNYKREIIKAYFAENDNKYRISWYDEKAPLGTGGGLSLLRGKITSTFFFANCDSIMKADYDKMVEFHKSNKNTITMVCAQKNISIPYGVVDVSDNMDIKMLKEKPMMSFLTNAGMYIVEPQVIDDIKDNEAIGFPDIIEREMRQGKKVAAYTISDDDWMDMGQLDELEKMRLKLYGN